MSSAASKEKLKIFETVLSSPGMTEKCKIVLVITRQNVLLLGRLIETGLLSDSSHFQDDILATVPKESVEEFKSVHEEMLRKSDLLEFYQKLKSI